MRHTFQRFASWSANLVGSAGAFLVAAVFCLVWAASGPHFAYSNSWQLVAKLDELVRAVQGARNQMIRVEELPDAELDRLEREMRQLRSRSPRSPT
ncbi:MAG: low affinity iron permease family protein [Gemmatimonadaceae bacterium]